MLTINIFPLKCKPIISWGLLNLCFKVRFANLKNFSLQGSKFLFQLVSREGRVHRLEGCKRHGTSADKTTRAHWDIGWCSVCWAGIRREQVASRKITPTQGKIGVGWHNC
jgi:hypothetical protein